MIQNFTRKTWRQENIGKPWIWWVNRKDMWRGNVICISGPSSAALFPLHFPSWQRRKAKSQTTDHVARRRDQRRDLVNTITKSELPNTAENLTKPRLSASIPQPYSTDLYTHGRWFSVSYVSQFRSFIIYTHKNFSGDQIITRRTGHVARMVGRRGAYKILVGKPGENRPLGRSRRT
jgi:hypothetical protein